MLYVGVVDALLGIEVAESEKALVKQFGKKKKAAELNAAAVPRRLRLRAGHLHQAGPLLGGAHE